MLDKKGSRRFEHSLIKKIRSWVLGYWWTQLIDASRKLGDTYTGDGSLPVASRSVNILLSLSGGLDFGNWRWGRAL